MSTYTFILQGRLHSCCARRRHWLAVLGRVVGQWGVWALGWGDMDLSCNSNWLLSKWLIFLVSQFPYLQNGMNDRACPAQTGFYPLRMSKGVPQLAVLLFAMITKYFYFLSCISSVLVYNVCTNWTTYPNLVYFILSRSLFRSMDYGKRLAMPCDFSHAVAFPSFRMRDQSLSCAILGAGSSIASSCS